MEKREARRAISCSVVRGGMVPAGAGLTAMVVGAGVGVGSGGGDGVGVGSGVVEVEAGESPRVTTVVMVAEGRVMVWVTTRVRTSRPRAGVAMILGWSWWFDRIRRRLDRQAGEKTRRAL